MKIELRNVKYAAFASEETSCFHATVVVDGKPVAEVENDGHGGCDMWHPWTAKEAVDAYAATLPPIVCSFDDPETGKPCIMPQDADILIGELLNEFLAARDFKRDVKKRLMFTKADGKVYKTKALPPERLARLLAEVPRHFPDAVAVLNTMPVAEAVAIYRRAA